MKEALLFWLARHAVDAALLVLLLLAALAMALWPAPRRKP